MTTSTKTLKMSRNKWLDFINPEKEMVDTIIEQYDFHDLDREAILEEDQTARIDVYPDYVFLVLHFPKYNVRTKRYLTNEFNIFLTKTDILTFRYYESGTVDRLFSRFENRKKGSDIPSSGEMLYELIDGMLDKVFRMLDRLAKDLRLLEEALFQNEGSSSIIHEMMIKKRNIITLKHMIKPQIKVLAILKPVAVGRFGEDMRAYFENLEDKLAKIYSEIELIQENIESMEGTLKSIFDMQTNTTIKYLTVFSAFMLPLTLITSFFGMNVADVPFGNHLVYISIVSIVIFMTGALGFLKYFGKI